MSADLLSRITIEPGKMHGRPCIRGLRIRVMDVMDMLNAGDSREDSLESYPYLENEGIDASILFTAVHEANGIDR
jgi:uncharacterized protein (DUF433 family)